MTEKKLVYVAGPYRSKDQWGVAANIQIAERHSMYLIRQGYAVFTPHKNTAHYEYYEDGETITWETWLEIDMCVLKRCDIIYMIPGWEKSRGSVAELEEAKRLGLEIIYGQEM